MKEFQECLKCMYSHEKKLEPCAGCETWFELNKNYSGKENELSRVIMTYINEGC